MSLKSMNDYSKTSILKNWLSTISKLMYVIQSRNRMMFLSVIKHVLSQQESNPISLTYMQFNIKFGVKIGFYSLSQKIHMHVG